VPWHVPEFRTGVAVGAVAALALLAGSFALPRRAGPSFALAGVAMAAGALVGFGRVASAPSRLVIGVVGTGVVVACCAAWARPAWVAAIGVLPFAYAVAQAPELTKPHWLASLLLVAIPVGAAGAMAFETLEGRECVTPVLLAITAAGVYWAVPDTELPGCLLGVALPIAFVSWPLLRAAAGRAGAAASIVPVFWAASVGGLGRPASIVGATACLGLLVGLPVAHALADLLGAARTTPAFGGWRPIALIAAHTVLVGIASRAAGTRDEVHAAVLIAVLVGIASVVIGALFVATAAARPRAARAR
jgi:hypothetical protein